MTSLTFSQAYYICEGINRRQRVAWEIERFNINALSKMLSGKSADIELPWDNENGVNNQPMSEQEIERLKALAKERQKEYLETNSL